MGVDIFFVISGFLITGQLIRTRERNPLGSARSFFGGFYVNRIRRIMPASVAALAVSVSVAWLLFRNERAWSTTIDAAWSALLSGNWRFALNGTDYWAKDLATSPLQHFWSLAVEEQFYLVWPVIIFASIAAFKTRRVLGWIMAAIVVSSLVWAVVESSTNPNVAYFSTLTRTWELGVGALLAIIAPTLHRINSTVRTILAWIGLVGIAASVALITPEFAFPGPWALPPVLATAFVIAAGTGGSVKSLVPLTNPVMTYVGDLSYSLYLWHFPVIIFLEEFISAWHWSYYPLVFGLMMLLSLASYQLIEQPVRKSQFLIRNKTHRSPKLLEFSNTTQNMALGALSISVVGALLSTFAGPAPLASASLPTSTQPGAVATGTATADPFATRPALGELQSQILVAARATEWPPLTPDLDQVASKGSPDEREAGCGEPKIGDGICTFDTGKSKTAVVFSDSTGVALVSTLREAISDDYNVRGYAMAGCVSIDLTIRDTREQHVQNCAVYKARAIAAINALRPDVVFITNTSGVLGDIEPGGDGLTGISAWTAAAQRTVDLLKPSGAQIVLTTSAPIGKTISVCATRVSKPSDCGANLEEGYIAQARAALKVRGSTALDTTLLFCADGYCPAFVASTPVKFDTVHVTEDYTRKIAPAFSELFKTLST